MYYRKYYFSNERFMNNRDLLHNQAPKLICLGNIVFVY